MPKWLVEADIKATASRTVLAPTGADAIEIVMKEVKAGLLGSAFTVADVRAKQMTDQPARAAGPAPEPRDPNE